ncbi:MAG: PQQ-binding-like beta-propeller repeat protein [Phycisphaerales bacterium]
MKRVLSVAALVAASCPFIELVQADEWNVAVGGNPARNGQSLEVGPGSPTILWEGSRSGIVAQQGVIGEGLVIVNRITSFTIPTGTWIVAHELETGVERWAIQLPMNFSDSWRSRVTGVRDGQVYASRSGNTNAEYLYALDPADGSIIWQSDALITETSTESVTFAPNGDIITTGQSTLVRIDRTDGSTVWSTSRTCPTSGGCDASVFGDRVYIWEAGANGPVVTAIDLDTGARLYSSAGIGGGFIQQLGLFVGPDGTVYAPRSQNNVLTDFIVALDDTGSALVERWRTPIGFMPFASHGVAPDGSGVFSYTTDRTVEEMQVMKLDPSTGAIIDESPILPTSNVAPSPRLAVDADGKLYLTNGGFPNGELFCLTPELDILWRDPVPNVNVGGPALGPNGALLVCGVGTDVRVYRDAPELRLFGPEPGVAGARNTLLVTGGAIGEPVYFGYGFRAGVTNVPGCPGVVLDIDRPTLAGTAITGIDGDALLDAFVPASASGRRILLQAVERESCLVTPLVDFIFP